jgi:hypothetical protein
VAPSHQAILDAIQAHHTGESLANSPRLLTALPSGYSRDASALLYEDPIAISAIALRQASPEMAEAISRLSKMKTSPVVVTAYGEESSIKEASTTAGADTGVALVMAAIAIPNLLRAKIAANEASAAATIRTINTAEIIYASTYPKKGFAADLAALGPDPRGASFVSARHASVISADLGKYQLRLGRLVHQVRLPVHTESRVRAKHMPGLCGRWHSSFQQHGAKELLFHFGWNCSF